jgi:NAD-dependent dihydropyrimidine dehydrogenase PreA subunit
MQYRYGMNFFIVVITVAMICFTGCVKSSDTSLSVNTLKCKNCSACVAVCPVDALRIINGKAIIDPSKCIECGKCVETCPVNAIY